MRKKIYGFFSLFIKQHALIHLKWSLSFWIEYNFTQRFEILSISSLLNDELFSPKKVLIAFTLLYPSLSIDINTFLERILLSDFNTLFCGHIYGKHFTSFVFFFSQKVLFCCFLLFVSFSLFLTLKPFSPPIFLAGTKYCTLTLVVTSLIPWEKFESILNVFFFV